jgi:hypothetical protein
MKCKQYILLLLLYCASLNFTFVLAQPTISNFTPKNGTVGTLVTITGSNLSNPSSINIGGKAAIPISNNGTNLVAMVMPGAATGTVVVTTSGGIATGVGAFTVTTDLSIKSQQGNKFFGTDTISAAQQGYSVAVSADGNTAIVGGYRDNNGAGAAWIFSRSNGVWTQEGNKLFGTDTSGKSQQGRSVAISADGNTALVGGNTDSGYVGAVWVFIRNNEVWSQQGKKLVGKGGLGVSSQGQSVSLSADGNTAIVGGNTDSSGAGAAWIFSRSNGVWTQQGNKLIGTGATGNAQQGFSVAISADGNTAIIGGPNDNSGAGASWVFVRNFGFWSQQGNKLIGTSASSNAQLGYAVALSADGNTAIVGGNYDNNYAGAAWVFVRNSNAWTQQGNKLVGTGTLGVAQQGVSVAISADGNNILVGGFGDSSLTGAAWSYTRTAGVWSQQGKKIVGKGSAGSAGQGQSVALSADGYTSIIGGNTDKNNNGAAWAFTYIPPPQITSVSPSSGSIGTLVTITGTNLLNPSSIMIGGKSAILISNDGSTLIAMVMPGATSGSINITTNGGVTNLPGSFSVLSTQPPKAQLGNKLVGNDASSNAQQGLSVAISADGNTAVVGGSNDNNNVGAAWVYVKNAGLWTQQGNKLVGDTSGSKGFVQANQGQSVAISADGNTVIVGGYNDNNGIGAAWVYARNGTVWKQQGKKLVATGGSATTRLGYSVSLSADGNTAVIGGSGDNNGVGAVWVFTRTNGTWIQEGNKLVGAGSSTDARQGYAVSLSADGNTLLVGGYNDNGGVGAAWVFAKNNGAWVQQGAKLVGTGAIGNASQGFSVSLNADGNTALIGGYLDSIGKGAAWVFTRTGTTWSQQGNKLVCTGFVGIPSLGRSVSLSADGNIAMVGGYGDNSNSGAAWYFSRNNGTWTQNGNKIAGKGGSVGARQGFAVSMSTDGMNAIMGGYLDNNQTGAAWVFNFIPPPTIINFSPKSGPIGTLITITGTNLSNASNISIGTVAAIPISNDGNKLVVMVMPGTTNGTINLVTVGGAVSTAGNFTVTSINPPNVQQGNKLVGSMSSGNAEQGYAVAISADGNTAIVGGRNDNGGAGAAWIYTRSNGVWTQQGNKLIGIDGSTDANQGIAVAISADGNTAIVGGNGDAAGLGAAWVFERNGGSWLQQGNKLVGTLSSVNAEQGYAVAISADGNTAIVGGRNDNGGVGAAWVFKRNNASWTQQGNKLAGNDAAGNAQQGNSVAISADGNTAIVGGNGDAAGVGAAWIYKLSGTNWVQEGNKLIGSRAAGNANQGSAVSINADGNTAIVGGNTDSTGIGAAWVFTRTGSNWTQQGNKLVGSGATGIGNQGVAVSLSADGNTAIVGGNNDGIGAGAAWVYSRIAGVWNQSGKKLFGTGAVGAANQGRSVAFSADGITAIIGGNLDNSSRGAAWIFTYVPPPTINSFSPTSGPIGTLVNINGNNLLNVNAVVIAGRPAIIISNDGTNLVAMVMPGATTGAVTVSSIGGSSSFGSFTVTPTLYPNTQQGNKLISTDAAGNAQQGYSVAISADGNTAIVGGYTDNNLAGAAWVYSRNGNVWTQQGNKLIGAGGSTTAQQGWSVAINADGNTAVVGGYNDKGGVGAAWVFTRNNGVWMQQGEKLVGTRIEGLGNAQQGYSVSISADGNTMIMGGNGDNFLVGAAWVFTRNNGIWTQQGDKLVGTGAIGNARQGQSVSISADGKTAVVGGFNDNGGVGAVWVYSFNGTNWTQQGGKLIGTGAVGNAQQGNAVAVSADGNTMVVGGAGDNNGVGALWMYTRGGGGIWTQQGTKLIPTDTVGIASIGQAVSISADGTTVMIGGSADNGNAGAVWVFKRNASVWTQQGNKLVGTGAVGSARQGFSLSLSADGNTSITGGLSDNNNNGAAWVFTNIPASTITSATYNVATGNLVVTGINFVATAGPLNDIEVSRLSITGEGNAAYTLTSSNVEITNATNFTIQLNSTDSAALNLLLNKNGTSATDGTVYNLAADDFWMSASINGGADLSGNVITVSNVAVPTITSATYNLSSGLLVVTATGLLKRNGSGNDIDVSKLSFVGLGGRKYQLKNSSDVEITNSTSFSIGLHSTDKDSVNILLNKNGTSATNGTIYNLIAADDWNRGADPALNIVDSFNNPITVNGFPAITTTVLFASPNITTVYGSASNIVSFRIAGTFLQAGILVTAPADFEVSSDSAVFSNSVTIGGAGTLASTRVFLRLKSGLVVNTYSGNIVLSSINASNLLVPTPAGSVTPKELTITGITANNKAYDGNTSATISGTPILNGVLNSDIANVRISGVPFATFARTAVGINIPVTVVGYTITGSAASNYTLTQPSNLKANIFDADVSIMPNPFFSYLTIQLNAAATSSTSKTTVRLLSLSGKEYKSVTVGTNVSTIQLYGAELMPGVYFLEIKNDKYQQTKLVYKY